MNLYHAQSSLACDEESLVKATVTKWLPGVGTVSTTRILPVPLTALAGVDDGRLVTFTSKSPTKM